MRELSLDQLRTLVSIADLGTFSAAAQALHLAQPTISLHISELEERLNAQLLVRGGRQVVPTAAGLELVERARRLLRDADEAAEAVRRHAEGRVGRVRLGTSTGVVVHLLPQVLQAMGKNYPGIDVEVSIMGSNEAMARLLDGKLDIGLVATPRPAARGITISHWRSDAMMAFLPAAWKAPKTVTPQWLAERPLIFNEPMTHMYQLTMEWFAAAGCAPRAKLELNYTEAMKSLVVAGYGAAVLPWEMPEQPQAHSGLQVVALRPKLIRHIGIAHRPLEMLDGAARNLLQTLAQFKQAETKRS